MFTRLPVNSSLTYISYFELIHYKPDINFMPSFLALSAECDGAWQFWNPHFKYSDSCTLDAVLPKPMVICFDGQATTPISLAEQTLVAFQHFAYKFHSVLYEDFHCKLHTLTYNRFLFISLADQILKTTRSRAPA